ncbi:SLBB domain-containing protein [Hahella sp. SMD15-11]|uniref:SLBB domain-containing protein n=1 Tax=Thermohahella caldifontis TaxID=3142973 RepID=A0AB39USG9_9GAMM
MRAWHLLMVLVLLSPSARAVDPAALQQLMALPVDQQALVAKQLGVDLSALQGNGGETADAAPAPEVVKRPAREVAYTNDKLRPFGYELFEGEPATFAPVTDIPVPLDYVLGPGDTLRVNLLGKESGSWELVVDRTGEVLVPKLGRVSVLGLKLEAAQARIRKLIQDKMIGVEADVTLGKLRSFRVFVLGEARKPGSYEVSSLTTLSHALWLSGGVRRTGSLRHVALKRDGKTVAEIDFYRFLLNGDTSADQRLRPGDVIFVPTVGQTVTVKGAVKRPAIYELTERDLTLRSALTLAGGLSPDANPGQITLTRVDSRGRQLIQTLALKSDGAASLRNGDVVSVPGKAGVLANGVALEGEVLRPRTVEWQKGLRISDLIHSIRFDLKDSADRHYALVVRENAETGNIQVLDFDPVAAISQNGGAHDLVLQPRDRVLILSAEQAKTPEGAISQPRVAQLEPLLKRLRAQNRPGELSAVYTISGQVRFPGTYPLTQHSDLASAIRAAGGLTEAAYTLNSEITRIVINADGKAETQIVNVPLSTAEAQSATALQPLDSIHIKQIPEFYARVTIAVKGEVNFPGEYTVQRGSTLSELIRRAGGLTAQAYPKGAVFSRAKLRELEAQRLQEARARIKQDLASLQIKQANAGNAKVEELQALTGFLSSLETSKPVGRMTIDLPALLAGDESKDVRLQDGDTLYIPPKPDSVTVLGEVQYPTSHLFDQGLSVRDYLNLSGGVTNRADDQRIYVVKANGQVWLPGGSGWFRGESKALEPGDTIYVPLDVERIDSLKLWTSVSQIFYQIALGAAAVNSL